MTAPISNGPTTTRLHHYAGHYSRMVCAILGLIPAHAGKTGSQRPRTCRVWAHPRSRGENPPNSAARPPTPGSSPLTRGKHGGYALPDGVPGLIPAHAGKTTRRRATTSSARAHPRSRGENFCCSFCVVCGLGSSPLTRGKLVGLCDTHCRIGLIPAHAGKTPRRVTVPSPDGAHPRSRGENSCSRCVVLAGRGSSPLTRGKPANRIDNNVAMWAHPRSRGENLVRPGRRPAHAGSSPLTRGKHRLVGAASLRDGLIPAHAGKTVRAARGRRPRAAHPRSRGENR